MDRRLKVDLDVLKTAEPGAVIVSATNSNLSTCLGNQIGELRILHRFGGMSSARASRPVSMDDAELTVAGAIAIHNRGRPTVR
ncbi:hypothetical protein [Sphingomonas bacterium]|uniref:hypothetical protein n=1 Tax=Sphingomonas bacterium TaxID=1895847 RepID=UPI001576BC7B|nr:hypothetical protein [Sphingomonas bacterium]